jgi:Leucine-rich repeat (LRR) protein
MNTNSSNRNSSMDAFSSIESINDSDSSNKKKLRSFLYNIENQRVNVKYSFSEKTLQISSTFPIEIPSTISEIDPKFIEGIEIRAPLAFLPQGIGKLNKLKYFIYDPPHNSKEFAINFDALGKLTSLRVLHILNYNFKLNLNIILKKLKNLMELIIHNDSIKLIPTEIGNLKKLLKLELYFRYVENIPNEIGKLKNLEELTLKCKNVENIPNEIGKLKNLEELTLKCKNVENIPNEIGKLNNLRVLDLRSDAFKNIPNEIFKLKNLEVLRLVSTSAISIPKEIGELKKLKEIVLFLPRLKKIPQEFENLTKLKLIALHTDIDTFPNIFDKAKIKNFFIYSKKIPKFPIGINNKNIKTRFFHGRFGEKLIQYRKNQLIKYNNEKNILTIGPKTEIYDETMSDHKFIKIMSKNRISGIPITKLFYINDKVHISNTGFVRALYHVDALRESLKHGNGKVRLKGVTYKENDFNKLILRPYKINRTYDDPTKISRNFFANRNDIIGKLIYKNIRTGRLNKKNFTSILQDTIKKIEINHLNSYIKKMKSHVYQNNISENSIRQLFKHEIIRKFKQLSSFNKIDPRPIGKKFLGSSLINKSNNKKTINNNKPTNNKKTINNNKPTNNKKTINNNKPTNNKKTINNNKPTNNKKPNNNKKPINNKNTTNNKKTTNNNKLTNNNVPSKKQKLNNVR